MFISLLFCLSGHNLWNWFVNDLSLFLVFFSSPVSPAVPHTLSAHAYIGLLIVHYSFFLLSCQMPAGVLWISFITACFGLLLCWWQCFYPALARSGEISHIVSPFHLCILFLLHNVLNSFSFCSLSIFSTQYLFWNSWYFSSRWKMRCSSHFSHTSIVSLHSGAQLWHLNFSYHSTPAVFFLTAAGLITNVRSADVGLDCYLLILHIKYSAYCEVHFAHNLVNFAFLHKTVHLVQLYICLMLPDVTFFPT